MKVLFIANNEISFNPRLLKAADVIIDNGGEVYVFNPVVGIGTEHDYSRFINSKKWTVFKSDISKRRISSKLRWFFVSALHLLYTKLWDSHKVRFTKKYYLNKGLIGAKIDKLPYDYIYINLVDNLPYAVKLKNRLGSKLIYDSQEHFVGQYQKYDKKKLNWVKQVESEFSKEIDILVATTNAMKTRLLQDYRLSVPAFRVRNVPSVRMLQQRRKSSVELVPDYTYLVWHGMTIYLENTRGVHILVQSIAKCKSKVKLVLQGIITSEQSKILETYIKKYNLKNKILLVPPASTYEIVDSIKGYHIGLIGELPEEDNQLLTSSNKLFDYINAGLPVIAPDLPGLNETVKDLDLGLIYKAGDVSALAEAIDLLISNKEMYRRFKENCIDKSSTELIWEKDFSSVWTHMNMN